MDKSLKSREPIVGCLFGLGNMGSAFSIDPLFGVVSVVKELDVRTMPEYLLTVRATDSGNPPLSNVTTVHIEVTIADDAPPK